MRPLRALVLSYNYPPGRGSGVYRGRAWTNHLVRRGHDVAVLTVDPDYYRLVNGTVDEALSATVDPRVRRLTVRVPRQHLVQDVHRMSWARACFPDLHTTLFRGTAERCFPEVYGLAYPMMAGRGLLAGLRRRPDVVVATGNPYAQVAAGRFLAKALRARLVVDFHDSWVLDQFTGEFAYDEDHRARHWERRFVAAADWVVTVNEPLAAWYRRQYPEASGRVRVVENGFAEDVVPDLGFRPPTPGAPLRLGYVGTIRHDLPLEEFREGWRRAREHPLLRDATFEYVGYLGFFARGAGSLLHRLGDGEDGIRYVGPVPQTELAATYRELDVLAMLTPSSPYVTAGKVFDYMAAGRPVVGVHDPGNDSTRAFGGYPLFTGATGLTPAEIAAALVRAAEQRAAMDEAAYRACRAKAMLHTWDAALEPLTVELEEAVRG